MTPFYLFSTFYFIRHISLQEGSALDLDVGVEGQGLDGNAAVSTIVSNYSTLYYYRVRISDNRAFGLTSPVDLDEQSKVSIEREVRGSCEPRGVEGKMGRKQKDGNSRSARLDIAPVGGVDFVHLGKVIHAGEEDVDLDDLVEAGASGLEDSRQVLDALVLGEFVSKLWSWCN